MWIVRLALRRPYTFVVMAILILIFGVVTIKGMSTDILPEIDIPVVSVIWQYAGPARPKLCVWRSRPMTVTPGVRRS